MTKQITIIGGGLAGCEAALQLAKRKISVILYEMRPERFTPAHKTEYLAELVCSNSLKSESEASANGLLKEELHLLDCELLKIAETVRVPAGQALAVNREDFARKITILIEANPYIKIIHKEIKEIPLDDYTIIASGPLTSDALANSIRDFLYTDEDNELYFYDAIAPIVSAYSLDMEKVFLASRYDKGEAAYLNSPLTQEEYDIFYEALVTSEQFPLRDFEKGYFFQGCMPIEEIATMVKPFLDGEGLWDDSYENDKKEWFLSTLDLIRDRFQMLTDFGDRGRAYFSDEFTVEKKPLKKNILKHEGLKEWLPMLADRYEALDDFNLESAEQAARDLATELDIKPGVIINGMRTVVTGQLAGPSMFDILMAIGRERVVARLRDVAKLYEE